MRRVLSRLVLIVLLALPGGPSAAEPPAPGAPSYVVTRIRFYPREGHADRIKGGRFSGSLTSATNDFEALAVIKDEAHEKQWTEIDLSKNDRAYRFIKWEGPPIVLAPSPRSSSTPATAN